MLTERIVIANDDPIPHTAPAIKALNNRLW
jgi:hypothetical protein